MKLYFIIDYKHNDEDEYAISISGNNLIGNTHGNRNTMVHPHENYTDLSHFIKYRVFRDQLRYNYRDYEHQLIEIPDEFLFQYMMIGLRDYDFIVYNLQTKRIAIGNDSYDCKAFVNRIDDNQNTNVGNYPKASSGGSHYSTNAVLDFNIYDEPEEEREDILVEINSTNGYPEILELLTPYVHNLYIRDTKNLCNFLSDHPGIGKNTMSSSNNYPSEYMDEDSSEVQSNIKVVCKSNIPGDSVYFIFDSYMNEYEIWKSTEHKYNTYEKECLRKFTLDIMMKFQENTGNLKWDVR